MLASSVYRHRDKMSEFLTDAAKALHPLTFVTRLFVQLPHIGTAIANLVAFPPFNYRGMQAHVSARIPHPVAIRDIYDFLSAARQMASIGPGCRLIAAQNASP